MDIKAQKNDTIGIIGFGRMGSSFALRLKQAGRRIIVYDPSEDAQKRARQDEVPVAQNLQDIADQAAVIFLLVPAGEPVEKTLKELAPMVGKTTILIDAGNSHFIDTLKNYEFLNKQDRTFLDCGTSGGVHGLRDGFCLMVGGQKDVYEKVKDIFADLAFKNGYAYVGPAGAGHYVKMVHNGIEYALLQAYAEGFHVLKDGQYPDLDLALIAHLWQHGSVIRSFILQLVGEIFDEIKDFSHISGKVASTGMGRWTVQEGNELNIPVTLIEDALKIRLESQKTGGNFATKLVAVLRNKFGGHHAEGCKVCHK